MGVIARVDVFLVCLWGEVSSTSSYSAVLIPLYWEGLIFDSVSRYRSLQSLCFLELVLVICMFLGFVLFTWLTLYLV